MKLVVMGNGMVGHERWNELLVVSAIFGRHFSLRAGRCFDGPGHSTPRGDDAHVLVR